MDKKLVGHREEMSLREELFDLSIDPPCNQHGKECEFWDVQGHYCWRRPENLTDDCNLISQLLTVIDKYCWLKASHGDKDIDDLLRPVKPVLPPVIEK